LIRKEIHIQIATAGVIKNRTAIISSGRLNNGNIIGSSITIYYLLENEEITITTMVRIKTNAQEMNIHLTISICLITNAKLSILLFPSFS